uniref:O-acyltransferase n=1 Tax=Panagrolaimus superbus TaxID=310955 RepID=A0A914YY41_9BILA
MNSSGGGSTELRKRRSPSSSSSSEEPRSKQAQLKKEKASQPPDQPCHSPQDSLFSSTSGYTNFWGFFNLAMLLLIVSNGRVALENFIKYGILISPLQWINALSEEPWTWPNLVMLFFSNITCMLVFFTEKILAKKWIGEKLALVWYITLISAHLTLPVLVTLWLKGNPLFASLSLAVIVIEALKLVSYIQVNYWCRGSLKSGEKPKNFLYPSNLTLSNFYYFLLAPTLCYELKFPRTPGRRPKFILKRAAEFICFGILGVALCEQWVVPLVKNSMGTLKDMDIFLCIERVCKLAVPNHIIWLLFFYTIFHSSCNLMAEILRFADREFYRDFWNAETIQYFWQTWNIPVHRWCVRHVYKPLIRNGYSRLTGSLAVFLISAIFHEYLVSVPLHLFRLWAFWAMLAQIPLSMFTEKVLKGGRAGNIVVWLSLLVGQPMAILVS